MFRITYSISLLIITAQFLSGQADSLLQQFMKTSLAPGIFVAVVQGDSVLYQNSIGKADQAQGISISATTCMELGSITKLFTAETIYSLHHSGFLNMQDPIRKYLPQAPKSWSGIKLQHLLNHTSGIPNYLADPRFMAGPYFTNTNDDSSDAFFKTLTPDLMTEMFYTLPLEFKPGFTWSYSNTGYYLLGKIAEIATGKPFFELIQERVTSPLGMQQTKANEVAARKNYLAKGYFLREGRLEEARVLTSDYALSAGALATSGADMIQFLKAIHGRRLPSDKVNYTWRIPPDDQHRLPFDYSGGRFYTTFHGLSIISHNGGTPGFSSSWIYVVEKNLSVIILMNRQDYAPIDQLAWDILACYEQELSYPTSPLNPTEFEKITAQVLAIIHAFQMNTPSPLPLTKPLHHLLMSENGKGYWQWYFEKGYPKTAVCVDMEKTDQGTLYRFLMPMPGANPYRLAVLLNKKEKISQLRWW